MKRTMLAVLLVGSGALAATAGIVGWNLHRLFGRESDAAPAMAGNAAETRVLTTLAEMDATGAKRFGVPESDGRMLRLLAEAAGAKNVVEVGTSTGYSGLWLSLAILPTDGHLTTFEVDPARAATAREYFRKAGVEQRATVIVGDAHKNIAALKDPIDVVFLDADKEGYLDYAKKVLPLVRRGGLILAHNVGQAPDYLQHLAANPDFETLLLNRSSGFSVTLRKR